MTALRRLASWLLGFAIIVAGSSQAYVIHSLRAEAEAIDDDGDALRWAVGGLVAAAELRLRSEAPYIVALAAAVLAVAMATDALTGAWMRLAQPRTGMDILDAESVIGFGLAATAAAGMALVRAHRWLTSSVLVGLLGQWETLLVVTHLPARTLADPLGGAARNHPHLPNLVMALLFVGAMLAPGLIGALIGGGATRAIALACGRWRPATF